MKYRLSYFLYCISCVIAIAGIALFFDEKTNPQTYQIILKTAIFTVSGISLFLCLWIKQDKPFFLLFVTLLSFVILDYFITHKTDENYYTLVAYPLMCILYPLNMYVLTHIKGHELFFKSFVKKVAILFFEIFFIYIATYLIPSFWSEQTIFSFQTALSSLLNSSFGLPLTFANVPTLSIFIFCICFSILLYKTFAYIDYLWCAFLMTFFLTFIAFFYTDNPNIINILFLASFGCILLSLLQTSHKLAFLDELTNIPGRRALMAALHQYENDAYTLAMIDIDFFKRLNDSYGHEVGDQALRTISARLNNYPHGGQIYRYGGEEFMLLFAHQRIENVLDNIEDMRKRISTTDFFLRSDKQTEASTRPHLASINITLSVGVCQKASQDKTDDAIKMADTALYKAKQTGRNKTVYNKEGKFYELF